MSDHAPNKPAQIFPIMHLCKWHFHIINQHLCLGAPRVPAFLARPSIFQCMQTRFLAILGKIFGTSQGTAAVARNFNQPEAPKHLIRYLLASGVAEGIAAGGKLHDKIVSKVFKVNPISGPAVSVCKTFSSRADARWP